MDTAHTPRSALSRLGVTMTTLEEAKAGVDSRSAAGPITHGCLWSDNNVTWTQGTAMFVVLLPCLGYSTAV